MDKNFFIAIILMTIVILVYSSPFYQERFGHDLPEKPQETTETVPAAVDRKTGSADSSQATLAAAPETQTVSPADTMTVIGITQINAPAEPSVLSLTNNDMRIDIDTRGGAIIQSSMLRFDGPTDGENASLIREGESWVDGYVQDGDISIDFSDVIFTIEQQSDAAITLSAEFTGSRRIVRTYRLDGEGYMLTTDTQFDGPWDDPHLYLSWHGSLAETEKPSRKIRIFPFSMFMRDDQSQYQKVVYLGQGERLMTPEKGKQKSERIYEKEGSQKVEIRKEYGTEDQFTGDLSWYAVRSKYFTSIVIPVEKNRWSAQSNATIRRGGKWFDFTIHKQKSLGDLSLELYCGPISYSILKANNHNLTEIMELSWRIIRPLSIAFLWLIKKLYTIIPNWGLVLIVFSLIIKVVLYPLSKSSIESMRKMSQLQPQINELREKYKSNPQKQQTELMDLYRREKINPMGGCLPLLLQMPVFFALYPVVGRAFELRQAMFIPYWIEDLSRPDPYFILPISMGLSMFFQQKATIKDPSQKAMVYVMPIMMVVLFVNFSSGLVLYWFMFNIMTLIQQKYHGKTPTTQS